MSISVAIVSADEDIRTILVDWINASGDLHCVDDFGDPVAGARALWAVKPAIILVDVKLAGMKGSQFVRRLKPLLAKSQFVMLSIYEDVDQLFDSLAAGATGVVSLREPRARFLDAIKRVNKGEVSISSCMARKILHFFDARSGPALGDDLAAEEREVLALIQRGYLAHEVASHLGVGQEAVLAVMRSALEKLQRSWDARGDRFESFSWSQPTGPSEATRCLA